MTNHSLFPLGQLVCTPGVARLLTPTGPTGNGSRPLAGDNNQHPAREVLGCLRRHRRGDWGDLDVKDYALNDRAVLTGQRILSAYELTDGTRIWVITEADRTVTTLLLPEEY